MSRERKGANNPNSKKFLWRGVVYSSGGFNDVIKSEGLTKEEALKIIDDETIEDCKRLFDDIRIEYEVLTCPHCNKDTGGKKPNTFRRWHFDRCKMKDKNEKIN